MYTKGDLLHFREIGFAGVYTKGYSDSQPFTHNDKSEEILGGTVTRQFFILGGHQQIVAQKEAEN